MVVVAVAGVVAVGVAVAADAVAPLLAVDRNYISTNFRRRCD